MIAKRLTPILKVSDLLQSFAWFEKLVWNKGWDWGSPATFGVVYSGDCEIFLGQNAHGGRGKSTLRMTSGHEGDDAADKGVWVSIWVDDVDAVYKRLP